MTSNTISARDKLQRDSLPNPTADSRGWLGLEEGFGAVRSLRACIRSFSFNQMRIPAIQVVELTCWACSKRR
jgi:hypothetical protein